jgi:LDH2 family malate/lactate/ureidoglycolate dehydrogenase
MIERVNREEHLVIPDKSPAVVRVRAEEIVEVGARALRAHGATRTDALAQARHLAEGELRGNPSHGLLRLPTLTARLDGGLIVSGREPVLEWTAPGTLRADGRDGFGPVVAGRVLAALLARVPETGVAVGAVRRSHHLGMLAPYAERVAREGAVGIILTTSEALVHPWGGRGALVGTNPIAIGVPARGGPVCLDMSTAEVSAGKILDYGARGLALPPGWAVDADGHPTTDARAAADGAISPFGGAKGYALGVVLESLVGLLTGGAFGRGVAGTLDTVHPVTKGDLMIVISAAALGADAGGADARGEALAAYLEEVRASGVDGRQVLIPGDRARAHRERGLSEGIDLDAQLWETARGLADGQDTAAPAAGSDGSDSRADSGGTGGER